MIAPLLKQVASLAQNSSSNPSRSRLAHPAAGQGDNFALTLCLQEIG
jgi:hypothetical protein